MKRSLFWNGLLTVLLGCLAGWIARNINSCVILQQSDALQCTQANFSENGRYLAGLVHDKNQVDYLGLGQLQLWDIQSGKKLGQIPESSTTKPVHLSWGCGNDGTLLSVRRLQVEQRDDKGNMRYSFIYTFYRKARDELVEHEVSSWTLHGSEMVPPNHQFAFSRDGQVLAHGVHEKGKVWIEAIDTTTGKVLSTLPIENAYFLMSIREFPRRKGFVVITHPPSAQPPGFDVGKSSMVVIDGTATNIEMRREYPNYPFEYSYFTADGEHLFLVPSIDLESPLLDLKTGQLVPHPRESVEFIKRSTGWGDRIIWPLSFGKSLMIAKEYGQAYILDWQEKTQRAFQYATFQQFATPLGNWLPGSSSLLFGRISNDPPNRIIGWYHQFLKKMNWGNPFVSYCELAILDIDTMQYTRWHSIDGYWTNVQGQNSPDGKQVVIFLNDAGRGMQIELWDNPMLPGIIPPGLPTGIVVGLIVFVLLQLLSRRRAARRVNFHPG